jgi:hypothetical protein
MEAIMRFDAQRGRRPMTRATKSGTLAKVLPRAPGIVDRSCRRSLPRLGLAGGGCVPDVTLEPITQSSGCSAVGANEASGVASARHHFEAALCTGRRPRHGCGFRVPARPSRCHDSTRSHCGDPDCCTTTTTLPRGREGRNSERLCPFSAQVDRTGDNSRVSCGVSQRRKPAFCFR